MTNLDRARRKAAELLHGTTGSELPEWTVKFAGLGISDEPNAIGPVCTDQDHIESEDPTAFPCCPDPVIEVDPALAEYLVELLNADRAAAADEDEERFEPHPLTGSAPVRPAAPEGGESA